MLLAPSARVRQWYCSGALGGGAVRVGTGVT